MKMFRIAFLLIALLFIPSITLHAEESEVAKIQKAYEGIRDIKGSFIQKNYIKDLKRTDVYNGHFFIRQPKMKWEYTGDKPQAIYVKPNEIIIYQKKQNQVIKSKFDKATYGQAPISLLVGFAKIREEFDVVSDTHTRVVLKPKTSMGNIELVEITPSEGGFPIKSLVIIDKLSNRVEIALKDVRVNTGLKSSLFNFTPPKDAAVLEQ